MIFEHNKNKQGIVYKIPCNQCNLSYVGQTGKSLQKRISQHKYCIRTENTNNALFKHILRYDHDINWDQSEILKYISDHSTRNIFEATAINHFDNFNLNNGIYKLDNIILSQIKKQNKNIFK